MDSQFLVAKYIPDLERMEPKNIGIILWSNGKLATRFVGTDTLELDAEESNYNRWINYWEKLANQPKIQIANRPAVSTRTPRFLSELQKTSRGNYVLDEGGEVADGVRDINIAADFLFSRLVASIPSQSIAGHTSDTLKQSCDIILFDAGVSESENFTQNYALPIPYGKIAKELHFHYAIAENGHPDALFLRVNIEREQSVTSAAGKYASVQKQRACPKDRRICLYNDPQNEHRETRAFLNDWSNSVNIASPEEVERLSRKIAG